MSYWNFKNTIETVYLNTDIYSNIYLRFALDFEPSGRNSDLRRALSFTKNLPLLNCGQERLRETVHRDHLRYAKQIVQNSLSSFKLFQRIFLTWTLKCLNKIPWDFQRYVQCGWFQTIFGGPSGFCGCRQRLNPDKVESRIVQLYFCKHIWIISCWNKSKQQFMIDVTKTLGVVKNKPCWIMLNDVQWC